MNPIITGLNKVHCVSEAANEGKTVTISNTYHTWEKVLNSSGVVDFIIPSMPAPEKKPYTITFYDGDTTDEVLYTRTIELGYGDSVVVGLSEADEPADQGDINSVEADLTALETRVNAKITYGTTDKVDGSSTLATGSIYCYY